MYSSTQKLTGCWQMCLCISFTNTNTSAESMHCLAVDVLCAWQVMCKILCNLPQFSWTDILHPTAKGRQLPSLITYLNLYKCQRWLWLACDLILWCTGVKLFLYYISQVLTIFFLLLNGWIATFTSRLLWQFLVLFWKALLWLFTVLNPTMVDYSTA